ncbi:MAG: prepilin-type N-terminal cleavage/methylation domain-containing protein [Saccharofermentans sp.]|jgi:prepilin-type N-terminal cleavage/methylation domain-containing protein|nr:prepilin-type N-terminal cleavage/methylation domain-containing protein [Saccharofermentans sp.]MDY6338576.1 prepilin-type N-terminal cleavage/methylation domain-containing protein [Saccharofermentans sp.]
MRRVDKRHVSKGGFSLLEILIVVAIIVILAGVVGAGVAGLIRTANNSNDAVAASSLSLNAQIHSGEGTLARYSFAN